MQAYRDQKGIVLRFGKNESNLLLRILLQIKSHYETPPASSSDSTKKAWYSIQGCLSAGMTADETQEWIDQLHQSRQSRLPVLNGILSTLGLRGNEDECVVPLPVSESHVLLSILNDHRLLIATRHGIGDQEMDLEFFKALRELEPEKQLALCEIDLLAHIMECMLQVLPDSGADWRKHLPDDDPLH